MNTQPEHSCDKLALKKYEPQDLILDDFQHNEMGQVFFWSVLENSGRSDLHGFFTEHSVGRNVCKTWENYKRHLQKQFQCDQLTQGITLKE